MLCVENLPTTLKDEGKGIIKGERERKICAWKGRSFFLLGAGEGFQLCICIENIPQYLRKMRGRKGGKGERGRIKMGREENIFTCAVEDFH